MSSILRSLAGYIADCHYDGIFCQETCFRVLPNVLQQLAFGGYLLNVQMLLVAGASCASVWRLAFVMSVLLV
jgi:hypothetical protein